MRYRGQQLSSDDFPQQLMELLAFLNRDFPAKHPFSRLTVSPDMPGCPEVWLLGSSMWSAVGGGTARTALRIRAFYRFQPDPGCAGALLLALHCVAGFVRAVRDGRAGSALR